jgi:hypothetical protein
MNAMLDGFAPSSTWATGRFSAEQSFHHPEGGFGGPEVK